MKRIRNIYQVLDERLQDNRSCGYEIDTKMLDTEDGKRLEILDLGSRVLVLFI